VFELNLVNREFNLIRETDEFKEFQSRETMHCWIIKKLHNVSKPIQVYHKHTMTTKYYHKHLSTTNVKNAVFKIVKHDEHVQSIKNMI